LLRERIKAILKRLEKVAKQREQGRRARRRASIATVSLVGYTNAGKSTLFNVLTSSDVYAADQLFATLDPTLRRLELAEVGPVILADTVGFIRDLPHDLVAAFKATLQETQEADLLLHVVDAADADFQDTMREVNAVLVDIEADDIPQLIVYNKIDKLENLSPRIERNDEGKPNAVWLSAQAGIGLPMLHQALSECLGEKMVSYQLKVPAVLGGKVRNALYEMNCIADEQYDDVGNWLVNVRLPSDDWQRLDKRLSSRLSDCIV
jgi:GTP-binding protein HflX